MTNSDKLIITVAPCGSFMGKDVNPNMPITPEEIAEEVYRSWNEGASVAHIHARDKDGIGTTDPEVFKEISRRIRDKGCDIILQFSTSPGREPNAQAEDGFRVLAANPEMISIDIGVAVIYRGDSEKIVPWTRNFTERLSRAALEKGIKTELEVYSVGGIVEEASYLIEKGLATKPYLFNFVLDMQRTLQNTTPYSVKDLLFLKERLPEGALFTTMGISTAELPAVTSSILLGGNARVGFEDNIYHAKGQLAKSNAEQVARVARIGKDLGRTIATPSEARKILGVK